MNFRENKSKSEYIKKKSKLYSTEASCNEARKCHPEINKQKQKVSDLVYQYLSRIANVYKRRINRRNARNEFRHVHLRKQRRNIYPKCVKKNFFR